MIGRDIEGIIKDGIGILKTEMNEINQTKIFNDDSKLCKKILYFVLQGFITFLFTLIVLYIANPTIDEFVSYINTPSFPLNDVSIIFPNNFSIHCQISFFNYYEESLFKPCPIVKGGEELNITKVLNKTNITIKKGGRLLIYFRVNENNYSKFQNSKITIRNKIFTFNRNNEVVASFMEKYYYLDNLIELSNERNQTRYFYYNIQSHRIKNIDKVYNFTIIDDSEIVRDFTWKNNKGLEGTNFIIWLEKMEYFKLTERKKISPLNLYIYLLGIGHFFLKFCLLFIRIVKKINEKCCSNNSALLLQNENNSNNDINIELENKTV